MIKRFNYYVLLKYLFAIFTFITLANVKVGAPFALSGLVAFLYCGLNPFGLYFTYSISAFIPLLGLQNTLLRLAEGLFISLVFFAYKKKKPRLELSLFILTSLIPYLSLGGITTQKAVYTSIILVFSLVNVTAVKVFTINGFKYKLTVQELISCVIFTCVVQLGFISLFGIDLFKAFCIFIILFSAFIYQDATALIVASTLSIPYAVVTYSFTPTGIFILFSAISLLTANKSRLLSLICVVATELFLYYFTYVYPRYSTVGLIEFIISTALFAFTPKWLINLVRDKLLRFKDKHLVKQAINRARGEVANKLFEISLAFKESFSSISNLKNATLSEEDIRDKIADNFYKCVCSSCPLSNTCKYKSFPQRELILKLASIGIAKGKLTLVDLPVEFTKGCSFSNNALYQFNKDLTTYKDKLRVSKTFNDERELLSLQSNSIANMIKEMAMSFSKQLSFSDDREKLVTNLLHKNGVLISEILIYGENDNCEITLVLEKEEFNKYDVCKILSIGLNLNFAIYQTINLSQTLMSVNLKVAPRYDAVFGISSKCKSLNSVCGDTHTLTKLSVGKFIIALNDGMGSGEIANKLSSTVLNLMESFFKAGLDYELTLKTLNRILAISDLESFSCLDLAIVDLFTGKVRFVKIGSPYGYILERDNIKIVESSSLPLGIVDNIAPISSETKISCGDVIVMTTDGVSDAFGSSTDLLEYLKNQPIKNPQKLSDSILNKALELDNAPKDDMTVLCVKIFEKNNIAS